MGGHGNAMGGVVSWKKELVSKIEHAHPWFGGLFRPMDAFLVTQGVKTLPTSIKRLRNAVRCKKDNGTGAS